MKRSTIFVLTLSIVCGAGVRPGETSAATPPRRERPNVVILVTDDQGYGDLGCHGNPVLKTPHLDKLHGESVRLTDFHVDPTCSPTRSALMTGRYSTRVGVWHTVMGRHMPRADEQLLPELFASNGYATAMFGKWHLGDNFPFRPQDRGFGEVLVHGGGGIGQIPDAWGNDYFDDAYLHNGRAEKFDGYCTDVFFREALRFIEANRREPFFVYLATNAPHSPYRVPDEWTKPYRSQVNDDAELASFYGMIANLDDNVGRLRARLTEWGLAENTLVVFLTDNGTARGATFTDVRGNEGRFVSGYAAGMRGKKGSPYEGGHRVPCFWHWPAGGWTGGRDVGGITAHHDFAPTLVDVCGLKPTRDVRYDGRNLRGVLDGREAVPADRLLVVHHQEMPDPVKYRFACVLQGRRRLILRNDRDEPGPPTVELFDLAVDPGQTRGVSAEQPATTAALRAAYESFWADVSRRFDEPAEIVVGDERANPVALTCFDRHGSQQWSQQAVARGFTGNGPWALRVARDGRYEIELRRWPAELDAPITAAVDGGTAIAVDAARVRIAGFDESKPIERGAKSVVFTMRLAAGSHRLETWFTATDGTSRGAYYAAVRRLGDR